MPFCSISIKRVVRRQYHLMKVIIYCWKHLLNIYSTFFKDKYSSRKIKKNTNPLFWILPWKIHNFWIMAKIVFKFVDFLSLKWFIFCKIIFINVLYIKGKNPWTIDIHYIRNILCSVCVWARESQGILCIRALTQQTSLNLSWI